MPSRLPFMKYWPKGGETYFREKILMYLDPSKAFEVTNALYNNTVPKIHTIREDAKGFWRDKVGDQVECFHWAGKPYRSGHDVFACLRIVSVQKIEIKQHGSGENRSFTIEVDGDILGLHGARELARNDGFENLEQFRNWFKKDFTGYILHFTEFRY